MFSLRGHLVGKISKKKKLKFQRVTAEGFQFVHEAMVGGV